LRLLQGLAISGEYTGATIFVAEHAPPRQRGFYTGFIQATVPLGLLLCLTVLISTQSLMSESDFNTFGWRIPFLLSSLLVLLSYFVRRQLNETPLYAQLLTINETSSSPVIESFNSKSNVALMVIAIFGGCAAQSTLMQTTHFVMLFFLQRAVYLSLGDTLIIIGIATLFSTPFFQVCGALSDKIGRKPVMLSGLILSAIILPIAFYSVLWIGNPEKLTLVHSIDLLSMLKIILLIAALHVCCAMVYGPLGAFILELFPTRIRFTSMGFTYNIGNGVLGGSTTFVTEFIRTIAVGSVLITPFAGLIYPLSLIIIAIVVNIFLVPETYRRSL
jgi:MFS family permease